MQLVDTLFRRGHLSERALIDAWQQGQHSAHLDRCDICVSRLVALTRCLDDVRQVAVDEADAAFPPERLAAQQAQILRRLEHLDRPARLLAFPAASRGARADGEVRRHFWPGWVVGAAAAGLFLGVLGDRLVTTQMLTDAARRAAVMQTASNQQAADDDAVLTQDAAFAEPNLETLGAISAMTPRVSQAAARR